MNQEYIIGTFVREEKNRFLCTVTVDGKNEECYIPSSCRLENFLELSGKEVILKRNQAKKSRTRYTVYAIKTKRNYMILKTTEANDIIYNAIRGRRFSFLGKRTLVEKEKSVEGYKADIYIPDTKTIIEVKSIISMETAAVFPTVYSERALEQLIKMKSMLSEGYNILYVFVSLNPYVESIAISNDTVQSEYNTLFKECVNKGMMYRAYTSKLDEMSPRINKEIQLIIDY